MINSVPQVNMYSQSQMYPQMQVQNQAQMQTPQLQDTFSMQAPVQNQILPQTMVSEFNENPMPSAVGQSPVGGLPDSSDMASSMVGYNINNYVFGDGAQIPNANAPMNCPASNPNSEFNGPFQNPATSFGKKQIAGLVALSMLGIAAIKLLTKKS